jgi:hypothetical protein
MPKQIILKKDQIDEIIDSDTDNIIGSNDSPNSGSNLESFSGHQTTDQNAQMAHQNFRNDFVGRFGWGFYESEEKDDSKVIEETEEEGDKMIEEEVVAEDIVEKSDDKSMMSKQEKQELLDKKIQKVADMLAKLNKDEFNKLINLVEKLKK